MSALRRRSLRLGLQLALFCSLASGCQQGHRKSTTSPQSPKATLDDPTQRHGDAWDEALANSKQLDGFFRIHLRSHDGRVLMEIPERGAACLYFTGLSRGVGSNALGLDRGSIDQVRIIKFERQGGSVDIIEPNLKNRAAAQPDELRAVEESFASSVHASLPILAIRGDQLLVDVTDYLVRDADDIAAQLSARGDASYVLDAQRSRMHLDKTHNFPKNTDFEVQLTYSGHARGEIAYELSKAVSDPGAVTVHLRHAFVALPDSGYVPRPSHPSAGYFDIHYLYFSAPMDQPLERRWLARHRLGLRRNTDGTFSVDQPIVYYVDRAAPEPIRSALLEGARWWEDAFAANGLPGAFRVELLPADVDPLDVRYNVIQWTHRTTRGWSYGTSIVDPRTGEIIKGHVTLGSQRIRQDYLIAETLLTQRDGKNRKQAQEQARAFALARVRQLAAHEVGHTLGLRHNFAASSTESHSVMDYPMPKIRIVDDKISVADAYEVGVGDWDRFVIGTGYAPIIGGQNPMDWMVLRAHETGARKLQYISDEHVWPGGMHPTAHRWDNGSDPVEELRRMIQVRARALSELSPEVLASGQSFSMLEARLVLVYLIHRYQVEAAVKQIGGRNFVYSTVDGQTQPVDDVEPSAQRNALELLLETLDAEFLAIPEPILAKIPPRPPSLPGGAEFFQGRQGGLFDPVEAAAQSAGHTLSLLLQTERIERIAQQAARNRQQLGPDELFRSILDRTFPTKTKSGLAGAMQRAVQFETLRYLVNLIDHRDAGPQTRAAAWNALAELERRCDRAKNNGDALWSNHYRFVSEQVARYRRGDSTLSFPPSLDLPPGAPIGQDCWSGEHLPNHPIQPSRELDAAPPF